MPFVQGLRRQEGTYFIKAAEGLDSLRKDLDIGAKADVAQNLRFDREVGSVTKRNSVAYYNSSTDTYKVDSIYRYYRESNNTQTLLMLAGGIIKSDYNNPGVFSTIAGTAGTLPYSGSNGRRWTAVTYNDLAILSTGYDDIIQTDGERAWDLGACKAIETLDSTVSQVDAGAHYYAVTFVVGTTSAEDAITSYSIYQYGSGYTNGDVVTVDGGDSNATLQLTVVDSVVTTATLVTAGSGYSVASEVGVTSGSGSGFKINILAVSGASVGPEVINGARSNTVTADATHTKITLSNIPLGPDACIERKIYRTSAGGATLKLLTTISDNSTMTYVDTTPDASLGATLGATTDDVPRGLYLYVDQERLFIAHDIRALAKRKSIVYYSEQFLPHYIPTASSDLATVDPADNYEWITPDDGDVITGLINQLGTTYVFKQNTIRPWSIRGTPEVWEVGSTISTIGCPAPYTIVNTPLGILYQGYDRMYLFNGQYPVPIIDDFNFDENFLDSRRYDNVGFFWNNLYLLAYTDANAGNSFADRVLIYDMIRRQSSIDKGGPITKGIATAPGVMNAGCFTSFRGSGEWGQLYAGDSADGWVYQYDRTINSNQLNTKTGFDSGTHSGSMAVGPEDNCLLTQIILDNMETYTTDALAQAAWVTSEKTDSKKIPPDLGDGTDGSKTVSADETLASGTYNYTTLTIDAGYTLTVSAGTYIKVLGTVTINGTLEAMGALSVYARAITIGAAGVLEGAGNMSFRANTITKTTGAVIESIVGTAPADSDSASGSGAATRSCESSTSFDFDKSYTITKITYTGSAYSSSDSYSSVYRKSVSCSAEIYSAGVWATVATNSSSSSSAGAISASISGTSTTSYGSSTKIRGTASASSYADHDQSVTSSIGAIVAYATPSMDYITGVGAGLPTSGSTANYVYVLDCYSEDSTVNQGSYALKVVCPSGADTLNQYLEKTISSVNLTSYNAILVDVWSLRTGTNMQFGLGNSSYATNLKNIVVSSASTWVTYELDYTGATKNAVTKIGLKFTNTDDGNVVYLDNIRPKQTTATYTSPILTINAQTLDKMYWNENLNTYGDITIDTRSGIDDGVGGITWDVYSTGLTTPAGSSIASTARKYFQFRVNLSTSDGLYFPDIYKANGYNIKFTYWKVRNAAETAVEFRYRTGWRNFDLPFDDKIYRKIITLHEGSAGYFNAILETGEQNTQTYTFTSVPLVTYPNRWYSTLPATMYGKELRLEIYKNDTEDFRLRQYGLTLESIPLI